MSESFTPGPWSYRRYDSEECEAPEFMVFASRPPETAKEKEANARLMAASPVMYQKLVEIRDGMTCVCRINKVVEPLGAGIDCTVCAINAILAEARGETA